MVLADLNLKRKGDRDMRFSLRLMFLLGVVLVLLGLVSGITMAKLGDQPLRFSWYMNYGWVSLPEWGTYPADKWLLENLKVKVDWIPAGAQPQEKVNTMIAADDLPDVMVLERGPDVERLVEAGKLVEITPFVKKYPGLRGQVGMKTLNMLKSSDGKLYQIPNWYIAEGTANGNTSFAIEKKIYKALGSLKLETYDDLLKYLRLVKAKYPNVVPLDLTSYGAAFIYATFGENRTCNFLFWLFFPDKNQLRSVLDDPALKEALLYLNRLYREKLLNISFASTTMEQLKERACNGRSAVWVEGDAVGIARDANAILSAKDPEDGWEIIWPIRKAGLDKNKVFIADFNPLGWNVNVITKKAKDPERIFEFLDWLTTPEGQAIIQFGPPGLLWDKKDEDGVPIPNETYMKMSEAEKGRLGLGVWNWVGNTTWVDTAKVKREMLLPPEKRDKGTMWQYNITWRVTRNGLEFSNIFPMPNSEEGIIYTRVKDIWTQYQPRIIMAKSTAEALKYLNEAKKAFEKAGYDKTLKYMTAKWQENLKRMSSE